MEQAIFGAGEASALKQFFEAIPGVVKVVIGFVGGETENPGMDEVISDETGHAEAVLVEYTPAKVSFEQLCRDFFLLPEATATEFSWHERPLIHCATDDQRRIAEKLKHGTEEKLGMELAVQIEPVGPFYQNEAL